ncbi:MAG: MerR family transcriptional regulator [Saprospiraceae bacterium]|nr:MerR family transcriptional regulator [Saprospiraceae bacterium]
MAIYSIRDIAKISGIKAHTIRIWEQRYAIIDPKRTASNIRYYTDGDLKFLMNVAFLNRKGIRISKIAKMSYKDIGIEVDRLSKTKAETSDHFQNLAIAMLEMDEQKISAELNCCFETMGAEQAILKVLVPFLEKTSLLCLAGSVNNIQEQFACCLIRRKVFDAINELNLSNLSGRKIILYLSETGQQELYLLFAQYLLMKLNLQVVYLGSKVNIEELKFVNSIHKADYIYTIVAEQHKCFVADNYIKELSIALGDTNILVSGVKYTREPIDLPPNVTILEDLIELLDFF